MKLEREIVFQMEEVDQIDCDEVLFEVVNKRIMVTERLNRSTMQISPIGRLVEVDAL